MGSVVLDASVILALFDPKDALHSAAATAARATRAGGHTFVLPASVFAEILVGAARRGQEELELRRQQAISAFGAPHPLDESVAVAAAARRARHHSLRLPDALVLATADVTGAGVILTGDKRWRGLDTRVTLVS